MAQIIDELRRVADELDESQRRALVMRAVDLHVQGSAQGGHSRVTTTLGDLDRYALAWACVLGTESVEAASTRVLGSKRRGLSIRSIQRWVQLVRDQYTTLLLGQTRRQADVAHLSQAMGDPLRLAAAVQDELAPRLVGILRDHSILELTDKQRRDVFAAVQATSDFARVWADAQLKGVQAEQIRKRLEAAVEAVESERAARNGAGMSKSDAVQLIGEMLGVLSPTTRDEAVEQIGGAA